MNNIDHPGNDLNGDCGAQSDSWKRDTPEECHILCRDTDGCELFSWVSPDATWVQGRKRCCLKHSANSYPVSKAGIVSGPKDCGKYNARSYFTNIITYLMCLLLMYG